tara:strand:+ start:24373 stop:25197 length:825 start_codon:yes stop_codon:yes gene_type:complete
MGLKISEDFYSVQCEGFDTGIPAYFVRLKGCNLTCGCTPKFVANVKRAGEGNTDSGSFKGDLHEEGKATWTCDSVPVWLFGEEKEDDYLIKRWEEQGILEDIIQGRINIIWTGGEPTMPLHQREIVKFMERLQTYAVQNELWFSPYCEIETNGTLEITDALSYWINRINCSVKLSNSGLPLDKRRNVEALRKVIKHKGGTFKFVISSEADIQEMYQDFINPLLIPVSSVCCMPGLDAREDFHERTRFVLEMAKKYKFRGLTRLHISSWDKATGV